MRQLAPVVRTRRMTAADLPGVMEIEKEAFSNPWSLDMVRKELTQEWSNVLLLEESTPWTPSYTVRPVSVSYRVKPAANTSLAGVSSRFARACSGAM